MKESGRAGEDMMFVIARHRAKCYNAARSYHKNSSLFRGDSNVNFDH